MSQTFFIYTDSYEMSPTQRISEEIPRTKQVGEKSGDNEFYPSLAFILIREFYKVDKRDKYRQC